MYEKFMKMAKETVTYAKYQAYLIMQMYASLGRHLIAKPELNAKSLVAYLEYVFCKTPTTPNGEFTR